MRFNRRLGYTQRNKFLAFDRLSYHRFCGIQFALPTIQTLYCKRMPLRLHAGRNPLAFDRRYLPLPKLRILLHARSCLIGIATLRQPQFTGKSGVYGALTAGDERRLSQACNAVLEFMQRQPIAATWGRSDLASSDMM